MEPGIGQMLAEARKEWMFQLPYPELENEVKNILGACDRYLAMMTRKVDEIEKSGVERNKASMFASLSDSEMREITENLSEWEEKVFKSLVRDENAVAVFSEALRSVRFGDYDGRRVMEGRIHAIYCIGEIASMGMKKNNINTPVIFDCISSIYQEAMLVGIGQRGWKFKDIREIAADPVPAILSLVEQVSGDEQSAAIIERGLKFLQDRLEIRSCPG